MDTQFSENTNQDRYKKQFFKTSLCKYHLEGACRKGDQCSHAHDQRELQDKPVLSKTRMCKSVLRNGSCSDPSCTFAHDLTELTSANAFFRTKMCEFYRNGGCKLGDKCRYAHSKEELNDAIDEAEETAETIAPLPNTIIQDKNYLMAPPAATSNAFKKVPKVVDYNDSPDTGYALKKRGSMGSAATMASSYASFGSFDCFQSPAPVPMVYLYPPPAYAYHPMYHAQLYHD